ncbi:unnamed protein product [Phytophthora fragariaefolia]|uniref:Unnamed protein product n=1 Tax=Phytophthora fragariaefolia TaxID=1490495 RepID=A0A9W6TKJ4_9STRA|nr:unnamed protein product [Phytophthora fragariaefolia]
MAKEYQAVEKAGRASEHNDSLSRQEKASLLRSRVNENSEDSPEDAEDTSAPVDESPRFYPVVHVSRLKAVREFGDRPKVWLARELTVDARLDFDEELLPEDSWEPNMLAGEYEVELSLMTDGQWKRVLGGQSDSF